MNTATTDPAAASDEAVQRIVRFFDTMTPQSLQQLADIYTEDAYFKDPFHEVRGLAPIEGIYRHMYEALDAPRFVVTRRLAGQGECFLRWDFHFRFRGWRAGVQQTVRGASHLMLADDGRISSHRDYWDAAEELYEKLPLLGGLMRWLKRRARG